MDWHWTLAWSCIRNYVASDAVDIALIRHGHQAPCGWLGIALETGPGHTEYGTGNGQELDSDGNVIGIELKL